MSRTLLPPLPLLPMVSTRTRNGSAPIGITSATIADLAITGTSTPLTLRARAWKFLDGLFTVFLTILWTIGWNGQLQSVDSAAQHLCLDDTNWNPNDGAQMQLWQCAS